MRKRDVVTLGASLICAALPLPLANSRASATIVDGSLCGLSTKKIEQGYLCNEQRSVLYTESHLDTAGTDECQDRDVYYATWSIIARKGKTNEKKSVTSDQPITGEWGDWYFATPAPTWDDLTRSICNHDIVWTTG
jgi:hypothetical protein